jgi:hypothetical protein
MAMNPEVKPLWLAALRSGEYEQATGSLARVYMRVKPEVAGAIYPRQEDFEPTGKVTYCCKGVLSDLAVNNGVDMDVRDNGYIGSQLNDSGATCYYAERQYSGITGVMPGAVVRWAGLAPHVKRPDYDDNGVESFTLGIDPELVDDSDEYTIGYTKADGALSSLDVANDDGQSFAQIADIIEAQF